MTPLTPRLIERVRVLRASGLAYTAIGEQVGMTKGAVAGLISRHLKGTQPGAAPRPRPAFYADSPGPGACCWPISENRPWRFCAADRGVGDIYCPAHRRAVTAGRSWQAGAA